MKRRVKGDEGGRVMIDIEDMTTRPSERRERYCPNLSSQSLRMPPFYRMAQAHNQARPGAFGGITSLRHFTYPLNRVRRVSPTLVSRRRSARTVPEPY